MKKLIVLLLSVFFIFCFPILGKAQTNPTDSLALVALYNAANGANWTNTWDLSQPVSTWYGVTMNGSRVANLNLYTNQLSGNIPPEIGDLTNLIYLDMGVSQLSGNIPPEIGNLANLTHLVLSNAQLSGSIPPEIGNLTNLRHLNLSNNQLSGSIPPEIGNLANLTHLYLGYNQLSGSYDANLLNLCDQLTDVKCN